MSDWTPVLPGYTVKWNSSNQKWRAVSDKYGTVLHGRTQRELELARNAVVMGLVDDLNAIFRSAAANGYSPPSK